MRHYQRTRVMLDRYTEVRVLYLHLIRMEVYMGDVEVNEVERTLQDAKMCILEAVNGTNSRIEAAGAAQLLRAFLDDIIGSQIEYDREGVQCI